MTTIRDWVDYEEAGVEDLNGLQHRLIEILQIVDMDDEVYRFGLRGVIDPERQPETAELIMSARAALRGRLSDPAVAQLNRTFRYRNV